MANTTAEGLTDGSALSGTEIFYGVVSPFAAGDDRTWTATQIKTFVVGAGSVSVASGKTATVSNTLTLTATDGSTLAIGAGGVLGTAAYADIGTSGDALGKLNVANTWAGQQTFVAPVLGIATGTSVELTGALDADAVNAADITAGGLTLAADGYFNFTGRLAVFAPADGVVTLLNTAENGFGRLQFGGTTSSFPAIKRNGANLEARLADDSGLTSLTVANITAQTGDVFAAAFSRVGNGGILIFSNGVDWGRGISAGTAGTGAPGVRINNGSSGGGYVQFTEMTAPSASVANNVVLYAVDNGSGKTQLMALFPTGAAQQIAIEP